MLVPANPIGNALGQLISPLVGSPKRSVSTMALSLIIDIQLICVGGRPQILVMGIIYTAVTPFVLIITDAPPTPPSLSYHFSSSHAILISPSTLGVPEEPFFLLISARNGRQRAVKQSDVHDDSPADRLFRHDARVRSVSRCVSLPPCAGLEVCNLTVFRIQHQCVLDPHSSRPRMFSPCYAS